MSHDMIELDTWLIELQISDSDESPGRRSSPTEEIQTLDLKSVCKEFISKSDYRQSKFFVL